MISHLHLWLHTGQTVGIGSIDSEIHKSETSQPILSSVDSIINEHMKTEFHGEWILLAEWNNVPEYGGIINFVSSCMSYEVFSYGMGMNEHIRESVDSLCRDGADRTRPFSKIEWLRTPKRGSYKPF